MATQQQANNKLLRRRSSLAEQWDKTPVVNVKQKFYTVGVDRYTAQQKATFTKWINIRLHSIPIPDQDVPVNIPQITAIDKDFRDGKLLIQLLHILHPNDAELPKPERGKTRHHHVANVTKALRFLETKLDDSGLAALKAIGPIDIVDGNVKLTLGLIWLIISKFQPHMTQLFQVEEEFLSEDTESGEDIQKESDDIQKGSENNLSERDVGLPTLPASPTWESHDQQSSPRLTNAQNKLHDRIALFESEVQRQQGQIEEERRQLQRRNTLSEEQRLEREKYLQEQENYLQKLRDEHKRNLDEHKEPKKSEEHKELNDYEESEVHKELEDELPEPQEHLNIEKAQETEIIAPKKSRFDNIPPPLNIKGHHEKQPVKEMNKDALDNQSPTQIVISPFQVEGLSTTPTTASSSTTAATTPVTPNNFVSSPREVTNLVSDLPLKSSSSRPEKRMSLPLGSLPSRKIPRPQSRFRTLHKRSASTPVTTSSWLIFWLNVQLVDYGTELPSSAYPIESYSNLDNGILLAALVHNYNKEWLPDYKELIKDSADETETKHRTKARLIKCFTILQEKLDIAIPKDLVSLLIENETESKEGTGIAWSMYIFDVFSTMTGKRRSRMRPSSKLSHVLESGEPISLEETLSVPEIITTDVENDNKTNEETTNDTNESNKPLLSLEDDDDGTQPPKRRPVIREPSVAPHTSLFGAVWEWSVSWMLSDNENADIYNDYYEAENSANNAGSNGPPTHRQAMESLSPSEDGKPNNDHDYIPFQLLSNIEQPSLFMYWG